MEPSSASAARSAPDPGPLVPQRAAKLDPPCRKWRWVQGLFSPCQRGRQLPPSPEVDAAAAAAAADADAPDASGLGVLPALQRRRERRRHRQVVPGGAEAAIGVGAVLHGVGTAVRADVAEGAGGAVAAAVSPALRVGEARLLAGSAVGSGVSGKRFG